ncbi:MAG: hypothetical protein GY856_53295 [bacterium]|nr:hypothetical protein [bacterium]
MGKKTILAVTLLASTLCAPLVAEEAADVVMQAMEDELARSMAKLQLEELGKPYFISYRVDDSTRRSASGSLGTLLRSDQREQRILTVEVRVGAYELDNSNFLSFPSFGGSRIVNVFAGRTELPRDDHYRELRRQIWLATDAVYKEALEDLARKKAALQTRTRPEEIPDFSKAEAVQTTDEAAPAIAEREAMEALVRELSAVFRKTPEVYVSRVDYSVATVRGRYVNSEGTSYVRTTPSVQLTAVAATQAGDGMPIEDYVAVYGRGSEELPPREKLVKRVEELAARLEDLREAELPERYNGPVLFAAEAAAELFSQAFAPRLLAHRRPVVGDERMASLVAADADFQDRIGARVLPRFLNVTDDPTQSRFAEVPLSVTYQVDDEGVPAGVTKLIERGYLKTLLAGRTPVAGVSRSTGHRRGGGVMPSNLIVTADGGLPADELRRELMLLVADRDAEYGIIVHRMGTPHLDTESRRSGGMRFGSPGNEGTAIEPIIAASRVYADGREEPLRNLELSGMTPAVFKEIVAAGDKPAVHSVPFSAAIDDPFGSFGPGSAEGPPPASFVVPALLFEELTLKKPSGQIPKPPVASPPAME